MTPHTSTTILFSLFFLFFVVTFIKAIKLKRQKDLFLSKLNEANGFFDEVRDELKDLRAKQATTNTFKNTLNLAEMTTQFQKPRLSAQTVPSAKSIPEKYSFVHSLIKRDMSSDEIASILSISSHEAAQLVALSKLGGAHFESDKTVLRG